MTPQITIDARLAENSGIGVYIRNISVRLLEMRPNWQFRFIGAREEFSEHVRNFGNASAYPVTAEAYGIKEQIELPLCLVGKPDLFWAPHYNAPLAINTKLLITIHDLNHIALPHLLHGAHRRMYARTMFSAIRWRAAGLFFVSDFTKCEFERYIGAIKCPSWITHNAVQPMWFAPLTRSSPQPRPYLVAVGNIKPHKNLSRLLAAFGLLRTRFDIDLVLVGKKEGFLHGHDLTPILEQFDGRVRMTGEVDDLELKQIVSGAEVLVAPSIYEGFGIPPLEAMAVGCPTVVARTSASPEICGDASEYVNPYDPSDIARGIAAVISNQPLRERLRAAGLEQVKRYSWAATADVVARAMEELIGVN